jgi:hypothetical protein
MRANRSQTKVTHDSTGPAHVNASGRNTWVGAALIVGAAYVVVGRAFAVPRDHVIAWRYAAWIVSGFAYAAQIAFEHFGLRQRPLVTAWHAALAVALGALGLAIAGMLHSLSAESAIRPAWLLALVLWPLFTAAPAFFVALGATAVLARLSRGAAAAGR